MKKHLYIEQNDAIGIRDPKWSWSCAFPIIEHIEDGIQFRIRVWNPRFQIPSNGPELSEALVIAGQCGVQESDRQVVRSGRCIDCGLRIHVSLVELSLPSGDHMWATDRSGCECVAASPVAVKYRGRKCIALADKYGIVPQALRPFLAEGFSWGMSNGNVGAFTQSAESADAVHAFLNSGTSFSELLSEATTSDQL